MRGLKNGRWLVALILCTMMGGAPFAIAATSGVRISGAAQAVRERREVGKTDPTTKTDQTALVQAITSRLGQLSGVESKFRQTQTLSALRTPVRSSGSLLFFREKGVVWATNSPIAQTFVITDAGVRAWPALGSGSGSKGAKGAAQIARMMQAMLSGDLSALYSQFDVQAQGTVKAWQMDLSPNQPQLAQVIKSVQLRGGDFLNDIRITFSHGDVTELAFSQQRAVTRLSAQQQRYFETP